MKIRIDKMLSNVGIGSRRQIKADAKAGLISVNGMTEKDSSRIVDTDTDTVCHGGDAVRYVQYIYLMMNKPSGVISATEDGREKTVVDLLSAGDKFYEPFPVGRLDKDTEGLLLLTNNGALAHNLLSPRKHVDKTYYVVVSGCVSDEDVKAFSEGVVLDDGYKTLPAQLIVEESGSESKCTVTVKEGKFHQIKRMFESVGKEVVYLKRLSMGPLNLDDELKTGQYRHLKDDEMNMLSQYMQ